MCILFLTAAHSYFNLAKRKVDLVVETYAKMEDAYREVCLMFDESPKQTDPSDFFGIFANFIKEWKVSRLLVLNIQIIQLDHVPRWY